MCTIDPFVCLFDHVTVCLAQLYVFRSIGTFLCSYFHGYIHRDIQGIHTSLYVCWYVYMFFITSIHFSVLLYILKSVSMSIGPTSTHTVDCSKQSSYTRCCRFHNCVKIIFLSGVIGTLEVCSGMQIMSMVYASQMCHSSNFSQAYANYAMGPPFIMLVSVTVSAVCFQVKVWCQVHQCGVTVGLSTAATLWSIPMIGICASWCWSVAHARSIPNSCSLQCFE